MRNLVFIAAFWPSLGLAAPDSSYLSKFPTAPAYNGISPAEAERFWERWSLVTTRFRKDNDQIRLTFANDVAMKALREGIAKFPDGSMFAKIVFKSMADPTFPAAQTPTEINRILIMKKNSAKYSKFDGWGYAAFTGREDLPQIKTDPYVVTACHACHQVVAQRDFVFSEPIFFARNSGAVVEPPPLFENKFVLKEVKELTGPEKRAWLALDQRHFRKLKVLAMPISKGALHTSLGVMSIYASKDGVPYLLKSDSNRYFVIVAPVSSANKNCAQAATFVLEFQGRIHHGKICDGKVAEGAPEL